MRRLSYMVVFVSALYWYHAGSGYPVLALEVIMNSWIVSFLKIAKIVSQIVLLVLTLFWFVFALLSGAEEFSGSGSGISIEGLLKNAPNAIPWLILLIFNYVIHRFNFSGGVVLFVFSWFTFFMFDMHERGSLPLIFLIFIPILLISIIFMGNGILNAHLRRDNDGNGQNGTRIKTSKTETTHTEKE